mmetsp:Transcript_104766/g.305905  ORF Transcript_104766/g.305905 Transcript_104766/m.305905 type:complete len:289 (+) Transcript_104766:1032-1898(+)
MYALERSQTCIGSALISAAGKYWAHILRYKFRRRARHSRPIAAGRCETARYHKRPSKMSRPVALTCQKLQMIITSGPYMKRPTANACCRRSNGTLRGAISAPSTVRCLVGGSGFAFDFVASPRTSPRGRSSTKSVSSTCNSKATVARIASARQLLLRPCRATRSLSASSMAVARQDLKRSNFSSVNALRAFRLAGRPRFFVMMSTFSLSPTKAPRTSPSAARSTSVWFCFKRYRLHSSKKRRSKLSRKQRIKNLSITDRTAGNDASSQISWRQTPALPPTGLGALSIF